jgi:hypothetical protein
MRVISPVRYRCGLRCLIGIALLLLSSSALTQSAPTLAEVSKTPLKYVGQKVCWLGRGIGGVATVDGRDGREQVQTTNWMGLDEKRNVLDLFFIVDEKSVKRSDAAAKADRTPGDSEDRLVCGTMTGTKEASLYLDRKTRVVTAPFIASATIDLPASK